MILKSITLTFRVFKFYFFIFRYAQNTPHDPIPISPIQLFTVFARHLFHKSNSYFILGAMDSFARGLKNAAKLIEDGTLDALVRVS